MARVKHDKILTWISKMRDIYQGHNCHLVSSITFDKVRTRLVSVISPCLLLLHSLENWQSDGDYQIVKIDYSADNNDTIPVTKTYNSDAKRLITMTSVCNFG
jgi:hypothetical protein